MKVKIIIRNFIIVSISLILFSFFSCIAKKYHPPHPPGHIQKPIFGPSKKYKSILLLRKKTDFSRVLAAGIRITPPIILLTSQYKTGQGQIQTYFILDAVTMVAHIDSYKIIKALNINGLIFLFCDSGATRTLDPQLRRLYTILLLCFM